MKPCPHTDVLLARGSSLTDESGNEIIARLETIKLTNPPPNDKLHLRTIYVAETQACKQCGSSRTVTLKDGAITEGPWGPPGPWWT